MRIEKIWVKGLFGMFDHDVPLRTKERITILHGLNGVGKTAILEMTEALLTGRLAPFFRIPFVEFGLGLADGRSIQVVRSEEHPGEGLPLAVRKIVIETALLSDAHTAPHVMKLAASLVDEPTGDHAEPGLMRMLNHKEWSQKLEQQITNLRAALRNALPELAAIEDAVDVRVIRTQRLGFNEGMPTVRGLSEELVERIARSVAAYAERASELDRTFPMRMLSANKPAALETVELQSRLEALDRKRANLVQLGILPVEEQVSATPKDIDPAQRDVLTVFVNDMEQKLGVFDDLSQRIELFVSMINERFEYTKLRIDRALGMQFRNVVGAIIDPARLSSGEQHEIVMLHALLFTVKPDSLILIDEPELSLHVAWQNQIVSDLEKLTALSKFDVVLATHSVDIINGRWDLAVALKGPPQP